MYARVRQIPIHAVDLRQVLAAALGTHIHLQLLMAAVVTVCQRQIDPFIKAHLHRTPDKRLYRRYIIINRIFHILDLAAVRQFPEPVFQILLLNRCNIFCHMTVEAVADILPVRNALHDAILRAELLDLQPAEILRRRAVNGIQIAVLFLKTIDFFIDILKNFNRKRAIFHQ